jgi:hypothetical protein
MQSVSFRIVLAACGAGLLAICGSALANHGKAGLWQVTVTMGGDDAARMPNMSNLPPEALAAMKAHGITMGGNTISTQQCWSAQEFALNKAPPIGSHYKNCAMSNVSDTGAHMTADMSCTGSAITTGHVQFDWDSDDHFRGEVVVTGSQNGQPVTHDEKIEGRYLSADCGANH